LILAAAVGAAYYYYTQTLPEPSIGPSTPGPSMGPSTPGPSMGPSTSPAISNLVITGEQETETAVETVIESVTENVTESVSDLEIETDEVVGQSIDEINRLSDSISNKMSDI
jgi:hypothetical protein